MSNNQEIYFNEAVHQTKDGDPVKKLDGDYKLRTDWKKHAVDGKGRKYDLALHGEIRLNRKGYLVELIEITPPTLLEQVGDKVEFNEVVHEKTDNGDPAREEDGSIRLKKNWEDVAVDRQGRKFNEKIHAEKHELDNEGYLKVRRRGEYKPIGATNRTEAFVNKYREDGYAYYVMNNEGGRMEQFTQNDWEPVMTNEGQASLNVGQARSPNTKGILMKKPIEWHETDQKKKREMLVHDFNSKTAPKEDLGQYAVDATPLR